MAENVAFAAITKQSLLRNRYLHYISIPVTAKSEMFGERKVSELCARFTTNNRELPECQSFVVASMVASCMPGLVTKFYGFMTLGILVLKF